MNHTLQTVLAWFGGISGAGYITLGFWLTAKSIGEHRRLEAKRAALRARRAPLTENDIAAVDFDAELANLTKENGR